MGISYTWAINVGSDMRGKQRACVHAQVNSLSTIHDFTTDIAEAIMKALVYKQN
jgi:hypothetical protein